MEMQGVVIQDFLLLSLSIVDLIMRIQWLVTFGWACLRFEALLMKFPVVDSARLEGKRGLKKTWKCKELKSGDLPVVELT